MSRWRTISAFLLQKTYGESTFPRTDSRWRNTKKALQTLDVILYPYAHRRYDNAERLNKLEEILKRGARFGFLIFSQPSLLHFDWDRHDDTSTASVIIFPALLQISDDNGQILVNPRVLGDQEIVPAFNGAP